jgi:hypothetical protein
VGSEGSTTHLERVCAAVLSVGPLLQLFGGHVGLGYPDDLEFCVLGFPRSNLREEDFLPPLSQSAQAAVTGHYSLVWMSKMRMSVWLVSGESRCLACRHVPSCCVFT